VVSARMIVAGSLWLAAGSVGAVTRQSRAAYPALLAIAAAVTAGIVAEYLIARRGDQITDSVLTALEVDRRTQEMSETPRRLRVVQPGRWHVN